MTGFNKFSESSQGQDLQTVGRRGRREPRSFCANPLMEGPGLSPSLLPTCPPGASSTLGSVLGPPQLGLCAVLVDGMAWRTKPTIHPHGLMVTELPPDDKRVLTKRAWMVGATRSEQGRAWGADVRGAFSWSQVPSPGTRALSTSLELPTPGPSSGQTWAPPASHALAELCFLI